MVAASVGEPLVGRLGQFGAVPGRLAVLQAESVARHDVRLLVAVVRTRVRVRVARLHRLVLVDDRLVEVQFRRRRADRSLPLDAQLQRLVVDLPRHADTPARAQAVDRT